MCAGRFTIPLALLCLALVGCAKSPQSVCSPDAALGALRKIVLSNVPSYAPKEFYPLILEASEMITLQNAVVDSYDKASGRVDCRGTISWTGPEGTTKADKINSLGIVYVGQPDAGGGGHYIYSASIRELEYIAFDLSAIRPVGWKPPARDAGYTAEDARRASYEPIALAPGEDAGPPEVTDPSEFDQQAGFTPQEKRLTAEFVETEGACRMESGSAGETACRQNDHLLGQLKAQGLCWGRQDEARADYRVHRCGPTSIR